MSKPGPYTTCLKCDKPGIEKATEILPDKGILIKVIHDNGSVCDFEEYQSIHSFINRKTRKRNPKTISCPVCGQEGLIEQYRPKKAKHVHKWNYLVVHGPLEGYWGRNHKIKKRRRCWIKRQDRRNEILKAIDRFNHIQGMLRND